MLIGVDLRYSIRQRDDAAARVGGVESVVAPDENGTVVQSPMDAFHCSDAISVAVQVSRSADAIADAYAHADDADDALPMMMMSLSSP